MAAWTEEEPLRKPKPARGGSGQASTGRRGGEGRGPEAGERQRLLWDTEGHVAGLSEDERLRG